MESTLTLEALVQRSCAWSTLLIGRAIPPEGVARILNASGVRFILAGTHATNAWTGRVRADERLEILVDARHHGVAVRAVKLAFPRLRVKSQEGLTRFSDKKNDAVSCDLVKPGGLLLRTILRKRYVHRIVIGGERLLIPDLEAMAAMKFAAMISHQRQRSDKLQDAVDFMRIVEANPKIRLGKLEALGERVYRGGGREILRLVSAIRNGDPLLF